MKRVDYVIGILVFKLMMELHDWGLHFEDLSGVPEAPYGTFYESGGAFDFLSYTQHWTLYWGFAAVLSVIAILLLIGERRNHD